MTQPFLIIGAGGHGRVVADLIHCAGGQILGFLDAVQDTPHAEIDDIPILGDDTYLQSVSPETVYLANGIGSTQNTNVRQTVFERLVASGFTFPPLVHPKTCVSTHVTLGAGCQIMAGSTLQTGVSVGNNTIINTGAIIDHHCDIGAHCHIAPGAVLCGTVVVGNKSHIGTGASVIQSIQIGSDALIAAGATVVRNVPERTKVAGVPAHIME